MLNQLYVFHIIKVKVNVIFVSFYSSMVVIGQALTLAVCEIYQLLDVFSFVHLMCFKVKL